MTEETEVKEMMTLKEALEKRIAYFEGQVMKYADSLEILGKDYPGILLLKAGKARMALSSWFSCADVPPSFGAALLWLTGVEHVTKKPDGGYSVKFGKEDYLYGKFTFEVSVDGPRENCHKARVTLKPHVIEFCGPLDETMYQKVEYLDDEVSVG